MISGLVLAKYPKLVELVCHCDNFSNNHSWQQEREKNLSNGIKLSIHWPRISDSYAHECYHGMGGKLSQVSPTLL